MRVRPREGRTGAHEYRFSQCDDHSHRFFYIWKKIRLFEKQCLQQEFGAVNPLGEEIQARRVFDASVLLQSETIGLDHLGSVLRKKRRLLVCLTPTREVSSASGTTAGDDRMTPTLRVACWCEQKSFILAES